MAPVSFPLLMGSSGFQIGSSETKVNEENELEINIGMELSFDNKKSRLFIAFLYPYTYEENLKDLEKWTRQYARDDSVYFQKELLIRSVENRDVHLMTITSKENEKTFFFKNEDYFGNEAVFPERKERPRR